MAKKDDSIVEFEERNFLPIAQGVEHVRSLVTANMGTDSMNAFDLDRAINPAGKGTSFTVPGLDGSDEMVGQLEGIIVHHQSARAYWDQEYKGSGTPPTCISNDGIEGVGTPGGDCATCPLNQFGSGENNSKACKQIKRLFLLREGEILPMLVTLSPVNYRVAKTYFMRLLSKRQLKYNHVVTKISLESARSKSGYDYAAAKMSMVAVLPPETRAKIEEFSEMLKPYLSAVPMIDAAEAKEFEEPGF